jgi:ribosomal protein L33
MPQKKIVKLRNKKTGQVIHMRKSGKPGSSTMPKLKLKKYNKVTRKREIFEESKK